MPVIAPSTYRGHCGRWEGHFQTLWPALTRRVVLSSPVRERLELPDGDFLDLDWFGELDSGPLVILTHGLEGSSRDASILSFVREFLGAGWNVLAWNHRGCSGEPNRLLRAYHSGSTDDLDHVVRHCRPRATRLVLGGFSLGGNVTLKYLGDLGSSAVGTVDAAFAISVPCDLADSAKVLERPDNRLYMARFLASLKTKIRDKARRFPDRVSLGGLDRMKTFRELDGGFTAPWNGFTSAEDYWEKCSCRPVLPAIKVPALLINARNDPFLGPRCFPFAEARANPWFFFEAPPGGGHLGFPGRGAMAGWAERRVRQFVEYETSAN